MESEVTQFGIFDMQVCVPRWWTDARVVDFANLHNPSGVTNGWEIRKEGHEALRGDPERKQCKKHKDYRHIMLEC